MMCYIALFIVLYYKMFLDEWEKEGIQKKVISRMVMSADLCIVFANYFAAMIKALTTINDSFPLSCIGSVLSEHYFGRLRRNSGNTQTMESIRSAINKIQYIDSFRMNVHFEELNHRRKLETAVAESGALAFTEAEIIMCSNYARVLLHSVHLFPELHCPFYYSLMRPIYNVDPSDLLELFMVVKDRKDYKRKKKWILNSAQFRVNSRYGRNITGRYITSAKPEQNNSKK